MKKLVNESLNEGFATREGRNLDRIFSMLGYDDFHEFMGDNPGCYEVIIEWIDETFRDQFLKEGILPEELEELGLYRAAQEAREILDDEE